VYPSTYADCLAAGIKNDCLTKVFTSDNSQNSVVYSDAKAATEYMIYVCAPNCGAGTVVYQTKQTTPVLYSLSAPTFNANNVIFTFSPAASTTNVPALLVKNQSGQIVNDPVGTITGNSVTWNNAPLGTYTAFLGVYGNPFGSPPLQVSNVVTFTVPSPTPTPTPSPAYILFVSNSTIANKGFCQNGTPYINLSWYAKVDTQFNIVKDGKAITSTTSSTWTSTPEVAGQTHTWRVDGITSGVTSDTLTITTPACGEFSPPPIIP
jgi:hypothetical protein